MNMARRLVGALGVVSPIFAVIVVLVAGFTTPGYHPLARTVSRLVVSPSPNAVAVDVAIYVLGLTVCAIAVALGPQAVAGRVYMAVAGIGLVAGAWIRLDPASAQVTALHRAITAVSVLALTAAMLAFAPAFKSRGENGYGRLSFVCGVAAVGMLLVGLALASAAAGAREEPPPPVAAQ